MHRRARLRWILPSLLVSLASTSWTPARAAVEFERDVLPILEQHCFSCHGGSPKVKGSLRLTSRDGWVKGGDGGEIVDELNPRKSRVLTAMRYDDEMLRMPPAGKLDDATYATLKSWIDAGMPWAGKEDYGVEPEDPAKAKPVDPMKGWSYRPVTRPEPPQPSDARLAPWIRNPIDAFVLARLEAKGVKPAPEADRKTFIRRATFDLTGLPPTPSDVDAFVRDEAPDAVEKLIDRLLASPHYGERWARHWLDVVRYADTNGFERDNDKPFMWRYRDYVIRALNEDKPYDRFVREQLAGDELDDVTSDARTATGFLRLMQWDDEPPQGHEQARYDVLDDIAKTTSEAFLGMSIGCARCHDHKVDPISQKDYYRFVALFDGLTDFRTDGCLADVSPPEMKAEFDRLEAEKREEIRRIEADLAPFTRDLARALELRPAISGSDDPTMWRYTFQEPKGDWSAVAYDDSFMKLGRPGFGAEGTPGTLVNTDWREAEIWLRRKFVFGGDPKQFGLAIHFDDDAEIYINGVLAAQTKGYIVEYQELKVTAEGRAALRAGENVIAVHCRQDFGGQYIDVIPLPDRKAGLAELQRFKDLKRKLEIARERPIPRHYAPAAQETGRAPRATHVLVRGNAAVKGDQVEPGIPKVVDFVPLELQSPPKDADTSYRRRSLADWIVDARNPLTYRVAANRLWQGHFGRGIVRSSSDFGELGERPTHPELLDWLAAEFVARGGSLKAMHKLIMTSATYRMGVVGDPKGAEVDPVNDLLWRFEPRRLAAEEIRDTMLAVNGRLNPRVGGPYFFAPMPEEVLATSSRPEEAWGESSEEEVGRRSLYIKVKRSLLHPMLTVFDFADVDASCPVRFRTTQPTQALTMLNSPEVNDQALRAANHLEKQFGADDDAIIRHLWFTAFSRAPSDIEFGEARDLLKQQRETFGKDRSGALQRLCLFVFNTNEFVYVD